MGVASGGCLSTLYNPDLPLASLVTGERGLCPFGELIVSACFPREKESGARSSLGQVSLWKAVSGRTEVSLSLSVVQGGVSYACSGPLHPRYGSGRPPSLLCRHKCGSDNSLIHSCRSSRGLPFSGSKDFRTGKEVAPWLLRV